jgi:superfamily II DNA or RNA helicase
MILHPFQQNIVDELEQKVASGIRRVIIACATGGGKTVVASEIIKRAVAQFKRVVFIAHRNELLTQAHDKLQRFGVNAGIVKAGRDKDMRPQSLVQICGIQTLHARAIRAKSMELPPAEIVFVDEAHHVRARTYMSIIEQYPGASIVGLTATPARGDGRGLGNVFEAMIEAPQVPALIDGCYLVPAKIFAPPPPDLQGVRLMSTGDYNTDDLSTKMDPLVGDVIDHWLKHSERRRTVCFAVDVRHSVHLTDEFLKSGVRAEHLDGETDAKDRDAILARLASGDTEIVSNVGVLTEGYDCCDLGCIVLARPTRSLVLFRQMIGRGLRPAPGKQNVVILDHSGGVHRFGRPDDVIEWTLESDKRATNKTHEARVAKAGSDPFCECKACGHIRMKGMACDACGWEPKPPPRPVKYIAGDLVELGKPAIVRSESERRIFYAELRGYQQTARKRDGTPYANGWAANQYRTRHGSFPPWSWNDDMPVSPSDATCRWIKSRQIAWAITRRSA